MTNPESPDGAGVIPLTGLDVVVLIAWGLMLILVGRTILKTVRDQQHLHNREHEQQRSRREARSEVPFADTHAFVSRSRDR